MYLKNYIKNYQGPKHFGKAPLIRLGYFSFKKTHP